MDRIAFCQDHPALVDALVSGEAAIVDARVLREAVHRFKDLAEIVARRGGWDNAGFLMASAQRLRDVILLTAHLPEEIPSIALPGDK